jgi:hypothetical protein
VNLSKQGSRRWETSMWFMIIVIVLTKI